MKTKYVSKQGIVLFKWLAILVPTLLFYFGWFLPGLIIGGDFQYRPQEYFAEQCSYNTWQSILGGGSYTVFSAQLPKFPIFYTSCLLNFMPYELLSRVLFLFPFLILSVIGMYRLLSYWWPKKHYLHIFGTVFYLINPTVLERLYRAHVWMPMVYALTPWIVLKFYKGIKNKNYFSVVWAAVLLSVALWYEIRMSMLVAALLFMMALAYLFYNYSKQLLQFLLKSSILGGIVVFFMNAFWLLPMLLYKPEVFFQEDMVTESSLMGAGKYTGTLLQAWHLSPLSWNNLYYPGVIAIIIFFIGFFLYSWKKSDKWWVMFTGLATLLFVFLGKGSYPPVGEWFVWMGMNIPFFVGYRVSSKFLLIAAFTFAIIIGWFVQRTMEIRGTRHFSSPLFKTIALLIMGTLIVTNSFFMLRGYSEAFGNEYGPEYQAKYKNEQNMFWPTQLEEYYVTLWNYLKEFNTAGKRAIWYPKVNRYRLATSESPQVSSNDTFYYQEDVIDNIFGPKGLIMNEQFHRLDIFMNLVNAKNIVVRPANELDWNYSKTQPYWKVIAAMNNQYYLKPKYLSDVKPYMLFNMASMDWNTNGDTEIINDNFYPQSQVLKYYSGFDDTYLTAENIEGLDLTSYAFLSFWVKGVIPETISYDLEGADGFSYDGYFKLKGKHEWQNVTIPLDPSLKSIDKIKLYMIGKDNTLTITPFTVEPAGLRMYELEPFTQDLIHVEQLPFESDLDTSRWQTQGEASIKPINTGFGQLDVLDYYSSDLNTHIARIFNEPIPLEDYDTLQFWMRFKKPETVQIFIKDSFDNVQKKVIKTTEENTWEPVQIVFDPVMRDIQVITITNVVTHNELQLTPFALVKSNVVPYERTQNLDEIYLSSMNLYVPDQEKFSCSQIQMKNFPVQWAMLGETLPDGLPYRTIDECINWLFMEDIEPVQNEITSIQKDSSVQYTITFDSPLKKDTVMVFGQSYSPYWEAYAYTSNDFHASEKAKIENHFPVNGYANAWLVPEGTTGIRMYFKPNFTFEIGKYVTSISFLILCLTYWFLRRKTKKA